MKEREPHAIGYAVLAVFAAAVGLWLAKFALGAILSPGVQLFAIFGVLGALFAALIAGLTAWHIFTRARSARDAEVEKKWMEVERWEQRAPAPSRPERVWLRTNAKVVDDYPQESYKYRLLALLKWCYARDAAGENWSQPFGRKEFGHFYDEGIDDLRGLGLIVGRRPGAMGELAYGQAEAMRMVNEGVWE